MTAHPGVVETYLERRARNAPIPLKRTGYEIECHGVLAAVTVTRLFKNEEKGSIEATMTFPVPFESVVTRIVTKIGGRTLVGRAVACKEARESYEDAIERGKAAVLHEELLRGLHMVSVANVAPGAEIEVAATFLMPFSHVDDNWRLRIPVTVGQVYGQIPLPDSDALLTGGPVENAELTIRADSGTPIVRAAELRDGKTTVSLDRPIDIELVGAVPTPLTGRSADGRRVTLTFSPAPKENRPLDAEILLDVSGSMKERVSSAKEAVSTKWDAVCKGLSGAACQRLTAKDRIRLWTFSDTCREIGEARGDKFAELVAKCPFDGHGTELPGAISKVSGSRTEANVLLITDGKSWGKINVQAALATGARFTVVLVGEDSLEVNVGYLAAMSGGQMFAVHGGDADIAVMEAISAMRGVASPALVSPSRGNPKTLDRTIGGVSIKAEWAKTKSSGPARDGLAAQVAAYAASLAIPAMSEADAAQLSEAEGIVSHLTSIVLVDEEGQSVEGIPATRKIALAEPATAAIHLSLHQTAAADTAVGSMSYKALRSSMRPSLHQTAAADMAVGSMSYKALRSSMRPSFFASALHESEAKEDYELASCLGSLSVDEPEVDSPAGATATPVSLRDLAERIDWDADPAALMNGDLSGLNASIQYYVILFTSIDAVVKLADAVNKTRNAVVIALIARAAGHSRTAKRIAHTVLAGADATLIAQAEQSASASEPL